MQPSSFIEYALSQGLLQVLPNGNIGHIPLAQKPFFVPSSAIEHTQQLTAPFQELCLKLSMDVDFLKETLSPLAQGDAFVKQLLQLLVSPVQNQEHQLLITRNDYFWVEGQAPEQWTPKQVEINIIAASFASLSGRVASLHQAEALQEQASWNVISNHPVSGIASGIAKALQVYGSANAAFLMVVQPGERNRFDQRGLEYELLQKHGIRTIRASLEEIHAKGTLKEGHLWLEHEPVGVVYFRAGYRPEDQQSEDALKGRQLIEQSDAIKTPTVAMQLAGLKKIQQELTNPSALKQFVSASQVESIQQSFVGIHALNETIEAHGMNGTAREVALQFPKNYVLKPQREGGGNNLYDADMVQALQTLSDEEQQAYILMERLYPPTQTNTLWVNNEPQTTECVSELGRYGVCLSKGSQVLHNEDVGYLIRTKAATVTEGGVAAGYACLGSLAQMKDA